MKSLVVGMFLRHVLTGIGAVLIEKGIASADEWNTAGGGLIALVGIALSYWNKKRLTSQ